MSIWSELDVENKVLSILDTVPLNSATPHPLGRPYLTSYQLAIELDERFPEVRRRLRCPLGGSGSGRRTSLAQYLARELSQRIRRDPIPFPIEGAFVSNIRVHSITYRSNSGLVESSLTGTGWDLTLFRRKAQEHTI